MTSPTLTIIFKLAALLGTILSITIGYGLYRDISEFDQTKGGYDAPIPISKAHLFSGTKWILHIQVWQNGVASSMYLLMPRRA